MGFLSYAQNFEDVMLWRALGHVQDGVYVDIGAQHPRIDSISRAFYERGWRGVHVEPVPAFAEQLRQDRPNETVLQVALGEREGTIELNVFANTGLSTAISSYAERHQQERGYAVERIQVPMLTTRAALDFLADKPVHWLKIDVEGFEEQVLRGWDSKRLRPWVLVIEATIPNSTETDYKKWEVLVIAGGYRFAYFDGLNRFYIANEHPELAAAFSAPPNIFDAVEVSGQASWGLCNFAVAEYQGQSRELTERLALRDAELAEAASRLALRDAELADAASRLALRDAELADAASRLASREAELASLSKRAGELEARLAALSEQTATVTAKAEELKHTSYYWWHTSEQLRSHLGIKDEELAQVYASRSWRLTEPLRLVNAQAKRVRGFAGRSVRWTLRQPGRVKRILTGQTVPSATSHTASSSEVVMLSKTNASVVERRLSPRASRLYAELKQVVERDSK